MAAPGFAPYECDLAKSALHRANTSGSSSAEDDWRGDLGLGTACGGKRPVGVDLNERIEIWFRLRQLLSLRPPRGETGEKR